jgi:hypothetical protein
METKSFSVGRKAEGNRGYDSWHLFPAILSKWPAWEQRKIKIQLDNAPPHPKPGNLKKRITDCLAEYTTPVLAFIIYVP